jgi:hypothetical protein
MPASTRRKRPSPATGIGRSVCGPRFGSPMANGHGIPTRGMPRCASDPPRNSRPRPSPGERRAPSRSKKNCKARCPRPAQAAHRGQEAALCKRLLRRPVRRSGSRKAATAVRQHSQKNPGCARHAERYRSSQAGRRHNHTSANADQKAGGESLRYRLCRGRRAATDRSLCRCRQEKPPAAGETSAVLAVAASAWGWTPLRGT